MTTIIYKCEQCGRTLPVCNSHSNNDDGTVEEAECQGCADVREGKHTKAAFASLMHIDARADGAQDKKRSAMEYAECIRSNLAEGNAMVAGILLSRVYRSQHYAVRMALRFVFEGVKPY